MSRLLLLVLPFVLAAAAVPAEPPAPPPVATFSIVACDLEAGEWGVAVQSKFFAVGSVVPWAKAGVGAVATQAYANVAFGPDGLAALGSGKDAAATLVELIRSDPGSAQRQIGLVDAKGRAASFTGGRCQPWAGGRIGPGYAVQGNILAGPKVVEEMERAYLETKGELSVRLLAALRAGQAAGGDKRGRQSAALLVVRENGGYAGGNDRYLDLRVDDHERPIEELGRLLDLFRTRYGGSPMARAFLLHRAGKTEAAIREARRAVRLDPENGGHRYNLACLLALGGHGDEAMKELAAGLERRPELADHAREDPDLEALRGREDYRKLLPEKR
jgi:uncharacterized Ntn-hydrolase superfamily protein